MFCALDVEPKHVVPIVPPADVVPQRAKNTRLVDDDSADEGPELVVASSSGPSSGSGLVRAVAVESVPVVGPLPILGAPVDVRPEYARGDRVIPPQWSVQCLVHANCGKSRSAHMFREHYGDDACRMYLQTWLANPHALSVEVHRSWQPKKRDIDAYFATL